MTPRTPLLALLLLPAPALAQDLDFLHQDITVDLTGDALHIEVDLEVRASDRATALALLNPGIPLTSMSVDGTLTEVSPDPTYPDQVSWITLPEALTAGDEATVRMVLDGEPHCASPAGALCTREPDETILFPAFAGVSWYFGGLFGPDPFTATVVVHAPAVLEVVAGQGAAESVGEETDGTRTWTYQVDTPVEEVAVYARAASIVRSVPDGNVAGYYVEAGDHQATMQHIVDLAGELLPVESEMYGPLAVDEVHVMTFSDITAFGGTSTLGNVFLQEFIFDDHYAYIRDQGIAHELSHSWWGALATAAHYEEFGFFAEAFAEYSAWRVLGELRGEAERISGVRMNSVWYMFRRPGGNDLAVLDPGAFGSDVYVWVTYHKGSSVLRTLEEVLGADAFSAVLADFVARGRAGLTTDALEEDALAETGIDVSDQINQWLRQTGYPTIDLALAPSPDGVTVRVETEDDFSLDLPLVFHLADGTLQEARVRVTPGAHEDAIALPAAPVLVEADPRWTLVRRMVPPSPADVTFDGIVDAADLIEIALRQGGVLPTERRVDGAYDPLYDVNDDERIDRADLEVAAAAD